MLQYCKGKQKRSRMLAFHVFGQVNHFCFQVAAGLSKDNNSSVEHNPRNLGSPHPAQELALFEHCNGFWGGSNYDKQSAESGPNISKVPT